MDGCPAGVRLYAKTIYRYLSKGMVCAVPEADLRRGGKPPVHSRKGAIQRSIAAWSEAGHGEMDTVKGPQNGRIGSLLTLTERKTRAQIIRKLPDSKAVSVVVALDALEEGLGVDFFLLFKSVTADNSIEFSDYEGLERSCLSAGKRFSLYFAHPYRASGRGSNENANGMIRRFFPKDADFSLVSAGQGSRGTKLGERLPPHDTGRAAVCPVTTW